MIIESIFFSWKWIYKIYKTLGFKRNFDEILWVNFCSLVELIEQLYIVTVEDESYKLIIILG